jgi:hypothetical protein
VHATTNIVTTPGYHSFLTYKQADVLSFLRDGQELDGEVGYTPHVLSETFTMVMEDDIYDGRQLHYFSATPESFTATLNGLARRGLVERIYHNGKPLWRCTKAGLDAARKYC